MFFWQYPRTDACAHDALDIAPLTRHAGGNADNRQIWRRVMGRPGTWTRNVDFMRNPNKLAAYLKQHCSTEVLMQGAGGTVVPEALYQPQGQGPIPAGTEMSVCTNLTHYEAFAECAFAFSVL